MKKTAYVIAAVLSLFIYSCSSDDDPVKVKPGPEEPNEGGLKTSELKDVLCATDVWKMDYQGITFYFQFKEDGTVISSPGEPYYLQEDVVSSYALDYNGNTKVLLTIDGSGALKYLENEIESTYIISAFSSDKITATGWAKGNEMNLIPASATEWNTLIEARETKQEKYRNIIEALKGNSCYGVLRNSDKAFLAHYKIFGKTLNQITFTYFEEKELKHVTLGLSITLGNNDSEGVLEFSSRRFNGNEISKIYFEPSNKEMSADGGLIVDNDNWAATDFYQGEYRPMHKIQFGGNPYGDATPRLIDELKKAQVGEIDLDDRGSRNIIFCSSGGPFQWVGYKGNLERDENQPGRVYFHREDPYYPVGSGNGSDYIQENCTEFLSSFFDSDGFFVIRDQSIPLGYLYMLSPTKDIWFQWQHD